MLVDMLLFRNTLQVNLIYCWLLSLLCLFILSLSHPAPMYTGRVIAEKFSFLRWPLAWHCFGYYQISCFNLSLLMGHRVCIRDDVGGGRWCTAREGDRSQNLKDFICRAVNLTKIVFRLSQSQLQWFLFYKSMLTVFIGVLTVSSLQVTL